jgi:hypothetical protein
VGSGFEGFRVLGFGFPTAIKGKYEGRETTMQWKQGKERVFQETWISYFSKQTPKLRLSESQTGEGMLGKNKRGLRV